MRLLRALTIVVVVLVLAGVVYEILDVYLGRYLCLHYKDGWLEQRGFIRCYRPP